jgi:UDP-N-acetylglucosamine--N-acetylmuramyl-(pentapeptide) pyrophosphoryl-undecaprenol N-acetylglucosamine transferase
VSAPHLVIAGGGTGGHFFSGVAFGEKFLDKYPNARVTFVGVKQGIEGRTRLQDSRMSLFFIEAKGIFGKSRLAQLGALLPLLKGFFQCLNFLLREKPQLVIGVGGYASAPMIFAAFVSQVFLPHRVRVVDQNSVPGMANRVFAKLGIPAYSGFSYPGFRVVDLPIRKSFEPSADSKRDRVWPPKRILLLGGSQGAQGLNQAWIRMLPQLKTDFPEIEVAHQTGDRSLEWCRTAYENLQISADCFSFRAELRQEYEKADLIIARAGALSIFEILAHRKPSIFVPFPFATHQHQLKNAQAVQDSRWILQEVEFTWPAVERILKSSKPMIPEHREKSRLPWQAVITV